MKKSILVLSTLSILSACNNGGGGSSKPALSQEEQLKQSVSVADYSAKVPPNKFTVIKANLSVEERKEMYGIGCKVAGESTYNNLMDPQLKSGLSFKTQSVYAYTKNKAYGSKVENIILSIEGNKVKSEKNYLEIDFSYFSDFYPQLAQFTSVDQVYSKTPNDLIETEFTGSDSYNYGNEKTLESNYTAAFLSIVEDAKSNNSVLGKTVNCSESYSSSSSQSSSDSQSSAYVVDKISYEFNGKTIQAYMIKSRRVIDKIVCGQYPVKINVGSNPIKPDFTVDMGSGYSESISVVSNDVVENGMLKCGGSQLYEAAKSILNENSKLVSSHVNKILEAPLR